MSIKKLTLSLLVILFVLIPLLWDKPVVVDAQENAYFEQLSIEDGLSQSSVLAVLQDRDGFLWFGTKAGLNCYDGFSFTTYLHNYNDNASISDDFINTLFQDTNGNIWIGTMSGGLNCYNKKSRSFTAYTHLDTNPYSISHNYVTSIYQSPDGQLWVGTYYGLNLFDPASGQFRQYFHEPANSKSLSNDTIWDIEPDGKYLWVGTEFGLNRFEIETGECQRFYNQSANDNSLGNNVARSLLKDNHNRLWIGTFNGLSCLDLNTRVFSNYGHDENEKSADRIRDLCLDLDGNLWVAASSGLVHLNASSGNYQRFKHDSGNPRSISDDMAWCLLLDNRGILWVGTYAGGVNKYSPNKQVFHVYSHNPSDLNSLSNSTVKGLVNDNLGNLWIATNDGLNSLNSQTGKYGHYFHEPKYPTSLSRSVTKTLCFDCKGFLWIGTTYGLNRLDTLTGISKAYYQIEGDESSISHNIIASLYNDSQGRLWVGTYNGVCRYDPTTDSFVRYTSRYKLERTIVYGICEEKQSGRMYFGTDNGLKILDPKTDAVETYYNIPGDIESLSNNNIISIYQTDSDTVWVGTHNGLNRFNPITCKFSRYNMESGLPNNIIHSIIPDNNQNLWMGTSRGLSLFNISENRFFNFYTSNGISSNEFIENACYKDEEGWLYFGTIDGLTFFDPSLINLTPFQVPIMITGFNLTGQHNKDLFSEIYQNGYLNLAYSENSFDIKFVALDYDNAKDTTYLYKLEGFDKAFREASADKREVSYTNLNNGSYTFILQATNSFGSISTSIACIRVNIAQPFWETPWFICFICILVIMIIYLIIRLRLNVISARTLLLEKQVAERTHDLENEINSRINFTRMVVHELKTPLTAIVISSGAIRPGLSDSVYNRLSKLLKNSSDNLEKRINELLDVIRGEAGMININYEKINIVDFLRDMELCLKIQAEENHLKTSFKYRKDLPVIYADREHLTEIINNLFENALKYTPKGGLIDTEVFIQGDKIVFVVSNTGYGIPEAYHELIFKPYYRIQQHHKTSSGFGLGLALVRMLVELHGGQIKVESTQGKTSTFKVEIPIGHIGLLDYDKKKNDLLP
ncbi:ligand-binding sensor domain-containing protein [Dehalococcoides mccartyi]|jgi:ligand-binding sensor domain-containing protein/signal transduction histidine kinase|uniref:ligand-binding sensor domain-containing protein n=1 Tax=Dehalococcoides mccartyi TaxID=61435 RepID=UPI000A9A6438|nr:sensor histidine kinase [Dehalococcoides mccartyi]